MKVFLLGGNDKKIVEEFRQTIANEFKKTIVQNNNLDDNDLEQLHENILENVDGIIYEVFSEARKNDLLKTIGTAAKISRADGTVSDILESLKDNQKDINLIKKVIGFGHKSVSEHGYLTFGIEDVSPIAEQILIGYRLTSFTIKSRRNVDFRNAGFYIPDFHDKNGKILSNNDELRDKYKSYMQSLFNKYGDLVESGIPLEDSRYILPYCFHSNIVMGGDLNELFKISCDLMYGENSDITEVKKIGLLLKERMLEAAPFLEKEFEKAETLSQKNKIGKDKFKFLDDVFKIDSDSIKSNDVTLVKYTEDPDMTILASLLQERYQISFKEALKLLSEKLKENPSILEEIMKKLNENDRVLEQANFKFDLSLSLAALTHLTRHRMQSLLVPYFAPLWNFDNYVIPNTIIENRLEKYYRKIYEENKEMLSFFKQNGVRDEDLVYFYLSGHKCNLTTTINGRTLLWISRMRCCLKAQWEIREAVSKMIEKVISVSPLLYYRLGPSCTTNGICNEGKDGCGQQNKMMELYKARKSAKEK